MKIKLEYWERERFKNRQQFWRKQISFWLLGKNHTCVGIDNDHLNYHVCSFYHTCVDFTKYLRHVQVFGKNHTCVVSTKYIGHVQVFGKNHTCVVFTKHLRLFQMFGKNHACVWKTKQACVLPNTGWYFLYLYLNLTSITQISYLIYILVIQDAQTQFCNVGKIRKTALYFTCVGIPTHIKQ